MKRLLGSKEGEAVTRKEEMGEKCTKVRPSIEKQIERNYLNAGMYMWQASMHFRNKNK